ncbi:MAG: hypothetical protein ACM3X5_04520 [Bacillota bacterium]
MSEPTPTERRWRSSSGETIACVEKLKMLRENIDEIRDLCQDAIDDAVLMGCDEAQFREALVEAIGALKSAYNALEK